MLTAKKPAVGNVLLLACNDFFGWNAGWEIWWHRALEGKGVVNWEFTHREIRD